MNHPVPVLFMITILDMIFGAAVQRILYPGKAEISLESIQEGNGIVVNDPLSCLCSIIASLLLVLLFAFLFRGEYRWKKKKGWFSEGAKLIWPIAFVPVLNLFGGSGLVPWSLVPVVVLNGLVPGIGEEVSIRGINVPNWMRLKRGNPRQIPVIATITALFFSLVHLSNLLLGASVGLTLLQVCYAFGIGVFFAAVYIRTGSLIWPVIMHSLIDITAFMNKELYETGGLLQTADFQLDYSVLISVAEGVLLAGLGYYYLRKEKRAEIKAMWDEKWPAREEDVSGTDINVPFKLQEEETNGK